MPLASAHLEGVGWRGGADGHRQPRRPSLDVEESQVVEPPLVAAAALRVIQLLEHGHRQRATRLQPHGEAERLGPLERRHVAEADLGVPIERRGPANLPDVERRIAATVRPCWKRPEMSEKLPSSS